MCQPIAAAQAKMRFPSEMAMLIGLVGNSFAIAVLTKSNLGLTTTSLFSYVMFRAVPALTLGTWSYLIQIGMIVGLAIYTRRVKVGYALSFVLAIVFGLLVDLFAFLLAPLPESIPMRVIFYLLGSVILTVGIAFFNRSRLPALPVDTFTRDLTAYRGVPFRKVRTVLDIICFVLAVAVGLVVLHGLPGIGAGTVISTLLVGTVAGRFGTLMDKYFYFEPVFAPAYKLIEE